MSVPDISRVYVILANIFRHLNSEDLESCSQVSKYFKDVVDAEKKLRLDVYSFLWSWYCEEHGKIDGCSSKGDENPRSIDYDIRLRVKNYMTRKCVPLLFGTYFLQDYAEILFSSKQPTVITEEFLRLKKKSILTSEQVDTLVNVRKKLREVVVTELRRYFPYSLQLIFSAVGCLTGCGEDLKPVHISVCSGMSGFIIPQYPGFEIHNFELTRSRNLRTVPVDSNIKGLLVFSDGHITFNRLMNLVHRRRIYGIAIGGFSGVEENLPRNGSVVAFCGESVQTASLVIDPSAEGAERKLNLFKETDLLDDDKKCFAFVFSSYSSGAKRIEIIKTFRRLYRHIPIAGSTGMFVYGVDYLPGVSEEIKTSFLDYLLIEDRVEYTFEDKSVFVLVSIKP